MREATAVRPQNSRPWLSSQTTGTFCVYPWRSLEVFPNGEARVCCKFNGSILKDGSPMTIHQYSLDEIWNSDSMRSIRRDMVEGKPVTACADCYEEERAGALSMRTKGLKGWQLGWLNEERMTVGALKAKAVADQYSVSTPPIHYQLNVGNFCNLKCRMCNSGNSVLIAEDAVHNAWSADQWSSQPYHDKNTPVTAKPRDERIWSKHATFVEKELLRHAGQIQQIYFAGGETLLIKDVADTLQRFLDAGAAQNIEIVLQSNGTVINSQALKLASRFKRLVLGVSIDGFGPYYEYIRYPGKWDTLAANIETLKALPNTTLKVSGVLQIYNALNIVDLFKYLDSIGVDFDVIPLLFPRYLQAAAMPPRARALAAERLRSYAKGACHPNNRQVALKSADAIEPKSDSFDAELLRDFMLFTNDLDATSGQSFASTHGELLELISETGFRWTDETLHATRSPDKGATVSPLQLFGGALSRRRH